jgi:hypothetical protein
MSHKRITHAPDPMPRVSGLLRLPSGRYVLNVRVPKDLTGHFGKSGNIRKSLRTSVRQEAVSRLWPSKNCREASSHFLRSILAEPNFATDCKFPL